MLRSPLFSVQFTCLCIQYNIKLLYFVNYKTTLHVNWPTISQYTIPFSLFEYFILHITKPHYISTSPPISASRLLTAMDLAVDPCEDFFSYACGGWNKQHILTDDVSQLDTMSLLSDNLQLILKCELDTRSLVVFFFNCRYLVYDQNLAMYGPLFLPQVPWFQSSVDSCSGEKNIHN